MAMPLPLPTYTTEDLKSWPDDGQRYELLNGILLVTPAPAHAHQFVVAELIITVGAYLREGGLGVAMSPGVIELAPSVHLEPDLLVHPADFGPAVPWTGITGWWLAVEVSGRSSRRYDRDYKRDAYLALGVAEVWLVDLEEKEVLVSRQDGPRDARHAERLTWHPAAMPAPLELHLARGCSAACPDGAQDRRTGPRLASYGTLPRAALTDLEVARAVAGAFARSAACRPSTLRSCGG